MSSQQAKLGKGLDSLIKANEEQAEKVSTELFIDELTPNPWQPRQDFANETLKELAMSIKNQGIIQPLLVRQLPDKSYQIVAGERRWRAAKMAGLKRVPVHVRSMTDAEVMTAALIENLQREDLNPMEEANALKTLRDTLHITQEELASKLGRSRSSVANALRLLQLSEAAQENVRDGTLSSGHARALLAISDGEVAEEMRKHIVNNELSVRETEELISEWKKSGSVPETDEESGNSADEKRKNARGRTKSEIAIQMQNVLSKLFSCKATVSGNHEKGRITLCYKNAEELQQLLEKLGVKEEETKNSITAADA